MIAQRAVKWALARSGMTQIAFAAAVGMPRDSLNRWLTQGTPKSLDLLPRIAAASGDPAGFAKRLVGASWESTWPDPRQEEAMDATLEAARMVSNSMAQAQDPLAKFGKLHSGMAAIYLLAYEAGRVQGMTGGEDIG